MNAKVTALLLVSLFATAVAAQTSSGPTGTSASSAQPAASSGMTDKQMQKAQKKQAKKQARAERKAKVEQERASGQLQAQPGEK